MTQALLAKEKSTTRRLSGGVEAEKERRSLLRIETEHLVDEVNSLQDRLDRGDVILMKRTAELEEVTRRLSKKDEELRAMAEKCTMAENETDEVSHGLRDTRMEKKSFEEVRESFEDDGVSII